jgi:PIN domain nuclease of toxin-antitoxin system
LSFLLDTHVLWWLLLEPERLRPAVPALLTRTDLAVHYSPLTLFELSVQRAKKRLTFEDDVLLANIERASFRPLAVRQVHALRAGSLPFHHRDPFDRLLIAQAVEEGMTLVSRDAAMRLYDVALLEV